MWTLQEALPLIRKISPIAEKHGFSVALYGSVLVRGESEKDLDLFFVEQDPDICDVNGCLNEISKLPEVKRCRRPRPTVVTLSPSFSSKMASISTRNASWKASLKTGDPAEEYRFRFVVGRLKILHEKESKPAIYPLLNQNPSPELHGSLPGSPFLAAAATALLKAPKPLR